MVFIKHKSNFLIYITLIGISSTNGSFISMVQPTNASFPGDGIPGMFIPNKNETDITWEFDESFRLECVKGNYIKIYGLC